MDPDGYLIIRLAANPDPGESLQPTELKIPFTEMRHWQPEQFGVRIEFPDKRIIIPWWNVLDLECRFNSQDYVRQAEES